MGRRLRQQPLEQVRGHGGQLVRGSVLTLKSMQPDVLGDRLDNRRLPSSVTEEISDQAGIRSDRLAEARE